jgi:hypothetical protein
VATYNNKFLVKNGIAVGVSSNPISVIDENGNWVGATGILTGASGVSGASGYVGLDGATGINGASGITGASGVDGLQGASGSTGLTGATGIQGINGASGSTGLTGATGPAGASGATGYQGASGSTGIQGASGSTGLGATGSTGLQGASGSTGLTGSTGIHGDIFNTTSTSSLTLAASGATGITIGLDLDYTTGQSVVIANSITALQHATVNTYNPITGALAFTRTGNTGTGTYTSWEVNLDGAQGQAGATGSAGVGGTIAYHGDFFGTVDIVTPTINIGYVIQLNNTRLNNGISVTNNGSSLPTRLTFSATGSYKISFTAQFENTNTKPHQVQIWIRKNGVDVIDSSSRTSWCINSK